MRFGERRFVLPHGSVLDYSGVGPLAPILNAREEATLARLAADRELLGVAQLLSDDRAQALRDRVARMADSREVLRVGDF